MVIRKSKVLAVLLAALMVIAFMPFLPGNSAHAGGSMTLSETSMTFDAGTYTSGYVRTIEDSVGIEKVESMDESIVTVNYKDGDSEFYVEPVLDGKAGTTKVKVSGHGREATLTVTVTNAYQEQSIKGAVLIGYEWYGSKKIEIRSFVKGSGTLKVGKDSYKFTASGDVDNSPIVKLKKVYPLKSAVKMTFKSAGGYTITKSSKFYADTYPIAINASKKKVKVSVYNTHKGDKIKIKYKGKTYTKKVKKDYDEKVYFATFKVKKKVKKNATIKVWIVNAKGKTLEPKINHQLFGGHWDVDSDDE